jgi:hypothetical protein
MKKIHMWMDGSFHICHVIHVHGCKKSTILKSFFQNKNTKGNISSQYNSLSFFMNFFFANFEGK